MNKGAKIVLNRTKKNVKSATKISATTNLVVLLHDGDFSNFFECILFLGYSINRSSMIIELLLVCFNDYGHAPLPKIAFIKPGARSQYRLSESITSQKTIQPQITSSSNIMTINSVRFFFLGFSTDG